MHTSLVVPSTRSPRLALALVVAAAFVAASLPFGAHAQARPNATTAVIVSPAAEKLPDNVLTPPTLFKLLMSEIAAQRDATGAAYATDMALARETRDPRLARRATELAVQGRDPGAAIDAARLWTELSPDSQVASDTYITLLVLAGRLDEVEPMLAAKIEGAPQKSQALSQVYGLLAQGQNRPQSLVLIRKLADRYPSLPEGHLVVAQAAMAAGDKPLAVDEARLAVKLQPDSENATIMLAQLQQYDAPKEVDTLLSGYLARNPKATRIRLAYSRFLNGERRYDDAAAQLARVRKDAPNNAETIYTLGLLAYQASKPKDAESYFKHFISLRTKAAAADAKAAAKVAAASSVQATDDDEVSEPDVTSADDLQTINSGRGVDRAYMYLAQIAEDAKDYPRALDWLSKVSDPNEVATARIRRALILAHQGKLDVARQELHALPAPNPAAQNQLTMAEAQMLREADQNQAAFDLLATAIENTPNNPDLLYDYGMTAEKLGKIDVLESSMRAVIRLRPDNAQAYNALGYTLADRNERLDEAQALIEKANALSPDDASILDSLGWVQYRLGNTGDAQKSLERAYKLRADAEIAVHLGEVLWVTGKRADAERAWREASVKEPQNDVLRQTLQRFNVQIGKR